MMKSFEIADRVRADLADLLDRQLSPLGMAAIDALAPKDGQTILDVGCGTGETIGQLAELVGRSGRVIGVDIGPKSLAVARNRSSRLPQVTLLCEDAATLDLPSGSLDGVYSRFGVMFFDDNVGAFSNFRRMIRDGGRIGFVCWRSLQENELDLVPLLAADLEVAVDETPFSFERSDFVADVLRSSGFHDINIRKFDAYVSSGNADAMFTILTKVGPLGKILREEPSLMAKAEPRVHEALASREVNSRVMLLAATWIVTATAA